MPVESAELADFHRFVGDRLVSGNGAQSPEEVLDLWRTMHPSSQAVDDDLAAVQEALEDIERGDLGIHFAEFDSEFRQKHGLASRQ